MKSLFRLDRLGLAPALALSTAVLTLTITFVCLQIVGSSASAQVERDIGSSLAELAYQTVDKLDQGLYERHREVKLMADRHEITDLGIETSEKRRVLESMQTTYPHYAWIGLTDASGKVLVSTGGLLEGADVSKRPWYGAAYKGDNLTDVHEAVLLAKLLPNPTGEPKRFFDIAFPYQSRSGKVQGVLGTHLSWQWAQDIEQSVLRPLVNRKAVDTLLVSNDGVVLLGPGRYRDKVLSQASFNKARLGQNGSIVESWADGKRYLVGYYKSHGTKDVAGLGWTVLVRQELEEAYLPVRTLKDKILWGGLIASIGVSVLAWELARRISRPLQLITDHAASLQTDAPTAIAPIPNAFIEVRILRRAINLLLRKVMANAQTLREANTNLEQRVAARTEDLRRAVENTQRSERRVRAVIDTALDAFVGVDQQGNITDWNQRAVEIFGWTRQEAIGRPVTTTIIPEQFREAHAKGLARFTDAASSSVVGKRLHLTALRKNGEEFPVEMTIGLVNAGHENFFGTFVQDISERKRIEGELANERELLDAVLDSIDVGVIVSTGTGAVRMVNRAVRDMRGPGAEPIDPATWGEHYQVLDAATQEPIQSQRIPLYRALHGEIIKNEELIVKPNGREPRFMFASGRALHSKDGHNIGAVIALKDVTELKNSERQLQVNERLLRTITDNIPVLISYIDSEERYQFINATYETWFGVPANQMIGKTVREVLGEELYLNGEAQLKHNLAGHMVKFETVAPAPKGERIVEVVGIPDIVDGVTKGIYVLTSDITSAKRHEQELNRLARTDTLTGLPNRRSYGERFMEATQRATRSNRAIALMFLDVDRFKDVNDTLGHSGGDVVLQEFGRRVKGAVRMTDTVCRLAGDEFTVILEGLRDEDEAALVAQKILASFDAPIEINGTVRQVSTSIGVAFQMAGPFGIDALSEAADAALYSAKERGRNAFTIKSI